MLSEMQNWDNDINGVMANSVCLVCQLQTIGNGFMDPCDEKDSEILFKLKNKECSVLWVWEHLFITPGQKRHTGNISCQPELTVSRASTLSTITLGPKFSFFTNILSSHKVLPYEGRSPCKSTQSAPQLNSSIVGLDLIGHL